MTKTKIPRQIAGLADTRRYFFHIDATNKKIRQVIEQSFAAAGIDLTIDQWAVLEIIYLNNDLSQSLVAARASKDAPTTTRILDLLCKKGLATRTVSATDRRSFLVQITPEGAATYTRSNELVVQARRKGWGNFSEEEYQTFRALLDRIYDNMDAD